MKMVYSSDIRWCGLSNWRDCLIPLPQRFSLWRPVKLAISENNMHRRIGGEGGKESGDRKTAFRKKREGVYAHCLKRWEDRQRRGECVEEAACECQSSSACQTSVIDHKPTQPLRCWGLSLNRCTSFTLSHIFLYTLIHYIHVCRWTHLRTWSLSPLHRAQTSLGCFSLRQKVIRCESFSLIRK